MKTSAVHARIEPQTKEKAEEILRSLGLTPTEAIRIFYTQISLRGGLPFPITIPNKLTASTLEKSRRGEDIQEFESIEGMFDQGIHEDSPEVHSPSEAVKIIPQFLEDNDRQ